MRILKTLFTLILITGPAHAQDWTAGIAARAIEGPGHVALMALLAESGTSLAPFTTDGCSGGLSDAWQVVANQYPDFAETHQSAPPWEACCVTHDRAYHNAGNASNATDSFDARLTADQTLRSCVIETGQDRANALSDHYDVTPDHITAAYASIAQTMFLAVRFGGGACTGLPWRWGYGYPGCAAVTGLFD